MNHDNFTEVTSEDAPIIPHLIHQPLATYSAGWASGYNTCLERTNAAELLQCLEQVLDDLTDAGYVCSDTQKRITNAIKKATDQNS